MKMRDWGEQSLIDYLARQFPNPHSILGIGDDCAIIPIEGERLQIATTDALVEGIHFLKEQIKPADLGYKSIAVNVSDIAAMGGRPKYAFLTLALPADTDSNWIQEVFCGIRDICRQYDISLLGGDTVGSKRDLFFNVTLLGETTKGNVKYRHTAKKGDIICTTGYLGNSGGGYRALQESIALDDDAQHLIDAHFRPRPHLEEGLWLASQKGVHAMMDLSDGIEVDLRRILKASQCGAILEIEKIPISLALHRTSLKWGWSARDLALMGGEDYCLLLTIDCDGYQEIQDHFYDHFARHLYPIGSINSEIGTLIYTDKGKSIQLTSVPFDHFYINKLL